MGKQTHRNVNEWVKGPITKTKSFIDSTTTLLTDHDIASHSKVHFCKRAQSDARIKQLRIRTDVVKRCGDVKMSYKIEAEQQMKRIDEMEKEGKLAPGVEIMKQCVQGSVRMIQISHRKLEEAVKNLSKLVEELDPTYSELLVIPGVSVPKGYVEFIDAKMALEKANEQLKRPLRMLADDTKEGEKLPLYAEYFDK